MKSFFYIVVFLLTAIGGTYVYAEKSANLDNNIVEEFGPNGCSKSMEPVHVLLTSTDGTETHFKIPKAYFWSSYGHKGGKLDVISLSAMLDNFKPACSSPLVYKGNISNYNNMVVNINIEESLPLNSSSVWGRYRKADFPDFVKTDELGFKIFRNNSKHPHINEEQYLEPPKDLFKNPSYLTCTYFLERNGLSSENCQIHQHFGSYLYISYVFDRAKLNEIVDFNQRIEDFLKKLIID